MLKLCPRQGAWLMWPMWHMRPCPVWCVPHMRPERAREGSAERKGKMQHAQVFWVVPGALQSSEVKYLRVKPLLWHHWRPLQERPLLAPPACLRRAVYRVWQFGIFGVHGVFRAELLLYDLEPESCTCRTCRTCRTRGGHVAVLKAVLALAP
ncbi:unnamed protein product [Effrenium voratum]|nr:unnamed protein product [Effrenium voratum]